MRTGKYSENIGKKFRKIRESKGLSLGDVMRRTKISKGYLSRLERGKIPNVSLSRLEELADFYNVDLASLLSEEKDWKEKLPDRIKNFIEENDIEYLELGFQAKEKDLKPEDIKNIINLLSSKN